MKDLLIQYGFVESSSMKNQYLITNYIAVIWNNNNYVTIGKYSPKYGRLLNQVTYKTIQELENDLKNNHY
jgi:hypothetical protein